MTTHNAPSPNLGDYDIQFSDATAVENAMTKSSYENKVGNSSYWYNVSVLKPQTNIAETEQPKTDDSEDTVLVPQIQSMKDYFILHYKDALCEELCNCFECLAAQDSNSDPPEYFVDTFRITDMSFWRESYSSFTARVCMSIDIEDTSFGEYRILRREYVTSVLVDMEDGIAVKIGLFRLKTRRSSREVWYTGGYDESSDELYDDTCEEYFDEPYDAEYAEPYDDESVESPDSSYEKPSRRPDRVSRQKSHKQIQRYPHEKLSNDSATKANLGSERWQLTDYLIPILRRDQIEEGAEALLRQYCPEAFSEPENNRAERLAQRMGLNVMHLPLYRRKSTRSILFFDDGDIRVDDCDGSSVKGKKRNVSKRIPGGTIVINSNVVSDDLSQLDIFHECIHYDWHFMFFRLQAMHNNDIRRMKKVRVVKRQRMRSMNPLSWMEWQAQFGSFGLMMPLSVMQPIVRQRLGEQNRRNERLSYTDNLAADNISRIETRLYHMGAKLDSVARGIAHDLNLPKYRVRARLIQMGYVATRGALNFTDGRYIEPFAFALEHCTRDYTFVIDRQSAYKEYLCNPSFRERLDSGRYVFADGHICINTPEYVKSTPMGLRPTTWANAHVDECCLRFINVYEMTEAANFVPGRINSDEQYNKHYLTFTDDENELTRQEQLAAMTKLLDSLPSSFHETLELFMRMKKITIERLEEITHISRRTIARLRAEERREYSLDQLIVICVALHLPPLLSNELLTRAGFTLRKTSLHRLYRFILDCMFMDSIDDIQHLLALNKQPPLKIKATD